MKPIKSTVYLPVKVEDELPEIGRATFTFNEEIDTCSFLANDGSFKEWYQHFEHKPTHWLKSQEAFVFTPEQLNEYTQKVIKQALEIAAERAYALVKDHDLYIREYVGTEYSVDIDMSEGSPLQYGCSVITDKQSITNTFEETFKKFFVSL